MKCAWKRSLNVTNIQCPLTNASCGQMSLFVDIRQGDCILSETASLKSVFYVKNGDFELKSGKGRRPPPGEKERGFLTENPGLTPGIAPVYILCGKTVYR